MLLCFLGVGVIFALNLRTAISFEQLYLLLCPVSFLLPSLSFFSASRGSLCISNIRCWDRFIRVLEGTWPNSLSVQSLSRVWLFVTPWTTTRQASLSITNSQSWPKPMSIELVMASSHLILCHPLLFLPSIFPNIRVFSNESALRIRWPKYWSFSFNISPSNEHPGLISFRMDWLDLQIV